MNKSDEGFLKLLEVSNDIALRLSNLAKLEERSLLCEINFPNLAISASYWDGSSNPTFDCDLVDASYKSFSFSNPLESFLHFPMINNDHQSYIELPSSILIPGKQYKAAGVSIASEYFIQKNLPGANNR